MHFKIFILFLSVNFSRGEQRTGIWRSREAENFDENYHRTTEDSFRGHGNSFQTTENSFRGHGSSFRTTENSFRGHGSSFRTTENSFRGHGNSFQTTENSFRSSENSENLTVSSDRHKSGNNKSSKSELVPKDKCGQDVPRRIIGGSTTDIDEFPWLGLLQYVQPSGVVSHDCSGVLISTRYVLTAAHCTHGLGITTRKMKLQKVRLGEWDTSTSKDCQGDVCSPAVQEIEVEDVIPHEKYKPREKSQSNDLALIRLKQEAQLNQFVQPICLPLGGVGKDDYEGKKLTVSGWGRTSNARDSSSSIKMKVDLPIANRENCSKFYDSFYGGLKIASSQFCAGGEDGKDSCQGDSGGPLMSTERIQNEVKWFVIGIVSSGPAACGVEGRPSLYTNVSHYTNWILDNIKT